MEKVDLVFDLDNARAADYVRDRLSMFNAARTGDERDTCIASAPGTTLPSARSHTS